MWTRRRVSAIGKAVVVNGELSGDEDLVIEGRVDGDINVPGNAVTVLKHGEVNGNTAARAVDVAGAVRGNITAVERVRSAGHVLGRGVTFARRWWWLPASGRMSGAPLTCGRGRAGRKLRDRAVDILAGRFPRVSESQ